MKTALYKRRTQLNEEDILWIIIPAYNETVYIKECLDSFKLQTDTNFRIVIVDNNSDDNTSEVVTAWIKNNKLPKVEIIRESQKGTGWACSTGFDYAIKKGAKILARTDADSIVHKNWVKTIRTNLINQYDFLGGAIRVRNDEEGGFVSKYKFLLGFMIIKYYTLWVRIFDRKFIKKACFAPGANMAITADLYTFVGGFRKGTIDFDNEDYDLNNRVLQLTNSAAELKNLIIYTSARRMQKFGLRKTLHWYNTKQGMDGNIDVR